MYHKNFLVILIIIPIHQIQLLKLWINYMDINAAFLLFHAAHTWKVQWKCRDFKFLHVLIQILNGTLIECLEEYKGICCLYVITGKSVIAITRCTYQ